MNNKPPTSTTTTDQSSTRGPLKQTLPYWQNLWGKTNDALNAPAPQQFIAPIDPLQRQSVDQLAALAPSLGATAPALQDMAQKVASGFFLDPNNDPTFKATVDAATRPITDQLQSQVLPQIVDRSMRTGGTGGGPAAYGGARQDIQENSALTDWERNAGDISAKLAGASRAQGMTLIPQASAIAQGANTIALAPSTALGLAGAQNQAFAQNPLDNLIKQYLFGFQGPQSAANILATGGFGKTNSQGTSTTVGSAPDMMTQWLQGLSGGAAGLSSLFGANGAFPGVGAAAGNSLAALLPMLSDRRFKEDIEQVGTSFSGQPIYVYKLKGLPGYQLGFMADELPAEVVHEIDGVSYVDYQAATRKDVEHGRT